DKVGAEYWPFVCGCSESEISKIRREHSYVPREIYENNPKIKKALDSLRDCSFAENDEEKQVFVDIFHKLIETHYGGDPDRYFTLLDLQSYYDTQLKAEELYKDARKWALYVIHNIAGMGDFSIDTSMKNYATKVWNIQPYHLDKVILDRVR